MDYSKNPLYLSKEEVQRLVHDVIHQSLDSQHRWHPEDAKYCVEAAIESMFQTLLTLFDLKTHEMLREHKDVQF